jgi:hypothetical protein
MVNILAVLPPSHLHQTLIGPLVTSSPAAAKWYLVSGPMLDQVKRLESLSASM